MPIKTEYFKTNPATACSLHESLLNWQSTVLAYVENKACLDPNNILNACLNDRLWPCVHVIASLLFCAQYTRTYVINNPLAGHDSS
jgi:hypothetical protein